ncbi:COG1399 Predicted metal-binding, possibly nucleic acid-binding protein [Microbacteriaceae bacterium]
MSTFEVPVNDLTRRPGQMKELELDIELAIPMGQGAATVPAGETIELNLRLESVHDGILATGEVDSTAMADCSRCLEPLKLAVEVDFQELFAYSLEQEDDFLVQDEKIDLEQAITDAVVLSLPFKPVCSEDCLGLCSECGVKLAEDPEHVHQAQNDSRWSELESFRKE